MNCLSCQQDLPPTARFCSSCGTPCATAQEAAAGPAAAAAGAGPGADAPPPGDERKPVTVLFCDLVGSTALSGVLDPETLRTVTLRYFEAMSAEIVARGGTPEKFIGDAVMAVFGVPVVRDDDARRALAAALGMRRALARLNEELAATLGIELAIRIGVNTGQVVAGSDRTARQALVSGETVNIAARLEQNAGRGEILIGPGTLLAAGPTVKAEPTGPLRLKGKRDSVEAHRLLALGADDPELLRRFDVPFVGRDAERRALDAALARAVRRDAAELLRVTGEAGIGKTRLVREWLAGPSASGGLAYGAGRCRSYGDHGTLAPLADAVRSLLAATDPAGTGAEGAREAAEGLAVDDAMALLSGGLLSDGTPNAPFEDMCAALATVLERVARARPAVLVLDDWHAAAPLLVRTVHRLTDGSGCGGVLVLCAGRPDGPGEDGDPPAGAGPLLQLTGLPYEEAARLASLLAGPGGGPPPSGDRLAARGAAARPDAGDPSDDGFRSDGGGRSGDHAPTDAHARPGHPTPADAHALPGDHAPVDAHARPGSAVRSGDDVPPDDAARPGDDVPPHGDARSPGDAPAQPGDTHARPGGHLPPGDDVLLARAGGNPLYLEQLLVGGRAEPGGGVAGEDLPPTLQALLGARIGALARAEREVVDLAAVIGREFTASELIRLQSSVRGAEGHGSGAPAGTHPAARTGTHAGGPEAPAPDQQRRVTEALAALARRRLVESGPSGQGAAAAHRFSSGLVHEVAYASLSKRAKAERHAWAAELPSVLRSGDGAVGGHLERAYRYRAELGLLDDRARRLRDRAAAALGRAGAQAASRSDLHWAHGLLERAVDLRPGDPAATRRLGELRVALGRAAEGAELLLQVRDTADDPVEAAHARLALAVLNPDGPGPGPAAVARTVLPVFEAAGDSVGRARAHLRLAQQFQRSGRHEEAERDQARALEHAVLAGAEPERAGALGAIGISLWRGPVPVPAAVIRCRTLLATHGAGRPTVRVTLNCPLAVLYALQDATEDAYGCLAEAERLARRLGFAEAEVFLPMFRATVEALSGRSAAALDLLGRADAAARRTGAAGMRTAVALDAARLELDEGREDRAAERLAGVGDAPGLSRADAVDLAGLRARLTARDRPEEAAGYAEQAVRASLLTDSPLVQATAELDRAHTLAALGRLPEATASAGAAAVHFTGKGHLPGFRRVSGFLAHPPLPMATTRERS
ncbi:adenylate/guanylate cyclase domain-containing protein [Streptomyces sp. NBRC 110465]|uniref:adenylate/guanylate cyclase domain-containing protein n=1 Tax=Streptomyces sp. NBRC 110465 TaxID=1897621 RepID=UPI000933FD20|nr:adenylate/guanylate cyclase domain-containing protein [Streptomyces sp. NBRC 110465]